MTDIKIIVPRNKVAIVHLVDAAVENVSYEVLYLPPESNTVKCGGLHAPIVRCGARLLLSTKNTPLVLELPGEYKFNRNSVAAAKIAYDVIDTLLTSGDVTGPICSISDAPVQA